MSEQLTANNNNGRKSKRLRLHELTKENDIKYRGPLSFGGLQIIGWVCIILGAVMSILKLSGKIVPDVASRTEVWQNIFEYASYMSLPLLLVVNFAKILSNDEGYLKQLLRNFAIMMGIYLLFLLFYDHYFVGSLSVFATNPDDTRLVLDLLIGSVSQYRYFAFNFFVDMFLCTLLMFFLNYKPKKVFTGKAIIIFRLFAIIPVGYELFGMIVKGLAILEEIVIPVTFFPLLPVKPVMTFVEFIVMAIFIKTREIRYCRHGKTHEEYKEFLKTNRNSLHFGIFAAVSMLVLGILDYCLTIYLIDASSVGLVQTNPQDVIIHNKIVDLYIGMGLGGGTAMVFAAPLMLLFSYTRRPKFEQYLIITPVAAIAVILLIVIQSIYQIAHSIEVTKIDIRQTATDLAVVLQALFLEGGGT